MSQSVSRQTRNTRNNPSAPQIFGSTTPFGPQTGSPIFRVTSNGVSAAAQSSTPFTSSMTFGASFSTDFGNTMSTFGASSTPAFSSSSSPSIVGFWLFVPFGSTCTPAFGSASMPAFGATSIPAFGGTSPLGSTTQPSHPAFGSSIFGSSTPFGGSSQPSFGATSSAGLHSTTSPPFRSTEAATGVSSSPGIGTALGFYISSTPASGSSSSTFGTSSNPTSAASSTPGLSCGSTEAATGVSSFPSVVSGHEFYVSSTPASCSSSSLFRTSSNPTSAASNTPGFTCGCTAATGVSSFPSVGSGHGFYVSSTPASGSSSSTFGTSSNPTSAVSITPGFGSTTQPSHPTVGSSIFGSSTPFGGSSQPPFGATSSAALRSTTSPPFRSTEAATGVSSSPGIGPALGFYFSITPASGLSSSTFGTSSNPTSVLPLVGSGHGFYVSSTPASGSSRSPFCTSSNPTSAVSNTPGFGSLSTPSFTFSFLPSFWKSTSTFPSSQFGPSCPSGAQSSPFGAQSKTFGNTAFEISASGAQLWGSRVPPHTTTTEPDDYVGLETRGDLQSISAMPIYGDKTHEELRWQDYQLGDRGGHVPAGGSCFPLSTSNILNPAPTFAQTSSSLFNPSTPSNIFAPQIPSFSFTGSRTSSVPFTSSTFPLSTSPNLFTTSSSSPSVFRQASSPSHFSSSDPSTLAFPAPAPRTDSTSNSGLFNSIFGVQSTTCGNTACGISASGGQFGGSRVAPYTKTAGPDDGSLSGLYQSICGMQIYGDKSHEELRWQDYQLGDRGGRALVGGNCFGLSTTQSNVLNPAPAFIQTSSSRLNTSTVPNIFAPQIPAFTPTPFGASFTPLPSASSFYVPGQISSPSLFSSSVTPTSVSAFPAPAPTTSPFNSGPINPISSIARTGGTAGLTTTSSGGLFTIPSGKKEVEHYDIPFFFCPFVAIDGAQAKLVDAMDVLQEALL
ncbi:hypothetical protein L3X38_028765 [Prunus dulcis]|uniref:Uncharacterized protein n=1 Tax=Prunus dulcis TaxID=3755 RepID=A0AAD4VRS1_PRUDU|nr:hypothetical protein L3X38_028765 [Prunus dulcis]